MPSAQVYRLATAKSVLLSQLTYSWTKKGTQVKLTVYFTFSKTLCMATISVLNGPNLNLLGLREPSLYGRKTLADIQQALETRALTLNHQISFVQYNAEHQLIETIHQAYQNHVDFIIINPATSTKETIMEPTQFNTFRIYIKNIQLMCY